MGYKVIDKEPESILNRLCGSQTRFQDYVFKENAEFSASTVSQNVPKISRDVAKLEQKLDTFPAVNSQITLTPKLTELSHHWTTSSQDLLRFFRAD